MRVELSNGRGEQFAINSTNGKLVAEWFEEYLPAIMSDARYNMPWRLNIWPQSKEESEAISPGSNLQMQIMRSKDFSELEQMFRAAKEYMYSKER
jgi:hypothetical protein